MRLDNIGVVVAIVAFAHVTDAYVPPRGEAATIPTSQRQDLPQQHRHHLCGLLSHVPGRRVVGIALDATLPEVRKKFRELAAPIHPDAPDGGDEGAFLALTAAYEQRLKKLQRERSHRG